MTKLLIIQKLAQVSGFARRKAWLLWTESGC